MTQQHNQELTITRIFNAPRALVWKAWTEAERLAQWWGPNGVKPDVNKLDFRPGGIFHYSVRQPLVQAKNGTTDKTMQSHGNNVSWGKFVYREIVAPEKLVFVSSFSDENGGVTRNPFAAQWPLEILNTLTLGEREGKTLLTISGGPINATAGEREFFTQMMAGVEQGFSGTFDQLEKYLFTAQFE